MKPLLLFAFLVVGNLEQATAALIFFEDFQSEPHQTIFNYTNFAQWDVVDVGGNPGGVDLLSFTSSQTHGPGVFVDLDGTNLVPPKLITKTAFTFAPGSYELSFDLAGPVGGTLTDTIEVELANVYSETFTLSRLAPWQTITRNIQITTPTSGKLSFFDLGVDQNGIYLDNVQLAAVPEPTTLAIWSLLGGIGLVVAHRRRRRETA